MSSPAASIGDNGSQEVVRLSPTPASATSNDVLNVASSHSYYNMSTGMPRGPSPVFRGKAPYQENGVEILKTNSKEEVTNASSPLALVTPDHASTSSC